MYNRKELKTDTGKKGLGKPKDILFDPSGLGQYKYPGQNVKFSGNMATMKWLDEPIYAHDEEGNSEIMLPGAEYTFPGNYITEYPIKNNLFTTHINNLRPTQDMSKKKQSVVDSIKRSLLLGIPVEPIQVKRSDGMLDIKDGHHRYLAYKQLGMDPIVELTDPNKIASAKSVIEEDQFRRGGRKSLAHFTDKNIKSSINFLMRRNEMLYGPQGRAYYLPKAEDGAWLDNYL